MRSRLAASALALALFACEQPEPKKTPTAPEDPTPPAEAPEPKRSELEEATRRVKAGELVTPSHYEALAGRLGECQVIPDGLAIDANCPARRVIEKARLDPSALGTEPGKARVELGFRLLASEHPATRVWGVTLAQNSPDSAPRLARHAANERDAAVLGRIARAIRTRAARDPEITKTLIELSRHTHRAVRREAATSLASSWARGESSSLARAIEMVEDPEEDPGVRKSTCTALGRRGEEAGVEVLDRLTRHPAPYPELYPACFEGLIAMWSKPGTDSAPIERAYTLTLERMEQTPRTQAHPPWGAFSKLRWVTSPKLTGAAPWVDRSRVERALASLVTDRDYAWMGRETALRTLVDLGVGSAALKRLRARVARSSSGQHDERVLRTLDDQIRITEAREASLNSTP